MKLLIRILTLAACIALAVCWSKEDYEIFDLVSAVENSEGKGTTFYSWLGVSEKASNNDITKAYKKKSLLLHPDKNRGVKGANERYARLGVVATILRSEGRERYDFWNKRGVPKWRGTGYYFDRFRPGIGTVLVFLTLLTSVLQHVVHRMNYTRELEQVRKLVTMARRAAWGRNMTPSEITRKVKVNLMGNPDLEGSEQEYGPSRWVDILVEKDKVYLLEDGNRHLIDETVPLKPEIQRTWPIALIRAILARIQNGREATEEADQGEEVQSPSSSSSDDEAEVEVKATKAKVQPAVKAGGRRRKGKGR